jgi:pimeloyl-ACP methyl ester carboxylesterase
MPDFNHPQKIAVNGIQLAVYEDKPKTDARPWPIVLVHGMPELAYSWRHQFAPLVQAGFHVIAPDMRGTGGSDAPANTAEYTVQTRLDDMCGLLDHYGYEKGIFVGHDFGGMVSWGMGVYRPERTAGVISLNCPFADIPMHPLELYNMLYGPTNYIAYFQTQECEHKLDADPARSFRFFLRRDTGGGSNLCRNRTHNAATLAYIHWIDDAESSWPGEVLVDNEELDYYAQAYRKTGFRGALNWYRCLPLDYEYQKKTFPNGLPKVTAPVLAVGSERDYICAYHFYDQLGDHCTDWEKTLIPRAGHWTQQEEPAALNHALLDWLQRRFS